GGSAGCLASRGPSRARAEAGRGRRPPGPRLAGVRHHPRTGGVRDTGVSRACGGGSVILAIESASTAPSVGVAEADGKPLVVDGWSGGPGQGRELLPRLM